MEIYILMHRRKWKGWSAMLYFYQNFPSRRNCLAWPNVPLIEGLFQWPHTLVGETRPLIEIWLRAHSRSHLLLVETAFQRVGPMPRIREIHCTETCRNHIVTGNRPLHNPWMGLVVCNYSVIYLPTILPTPTNHKHQVLWAYVRKLVMTHRIWIQSNPSYLYFSLAQQRGFEPDVVII